MIKVLIFDLGGVLIDLDMHQCFENIKALGIDLDAMSKPSVNEGVGSTICEGITASGAMHMYQVGKISTADFMNTALQLSNPGTTYQQVVDAWNSCLLDIPEYKLDFIKELRAKGYKTYMLSNTNDAHWRFIEDCKFQKPVSEYFEHCFLSQELQLAKPDPEIYRVVLREIGCKPEECLFLDDSEPNCASAETLGINCINIPVRTDYREDVRKYLSENSHLTIRKSTLEDIPRMREIFAHARQFMVETGNPNQWTNDYPSVDFLRADIDSGDSYVCLKGDRIVATFLLRGGVDPTYNVIYDGAWLNDETYATIHRIASDGTTKGILHEAVQFALRSYRNVRIDTHRDNIVMQNAVKKEGFSYCGIIHCWSGDERLAYQLESL